MVKSRKNKKLRKGGKVIGRGTYGCVFKPPLKCLDTSQNSPDHSVSKLLTIKNLNDEVKQTDKIKQILDDNNVTNYKDFCILPTSNDTCFIDLDDDNNIKELKEGVTNSNFYRDCKPIYKNLDNIKDLDRYEHNDKKFKALNMIDGGVDFHDYLENTLVMKIEVEDKKNIFVLSEDSDKKQYYDTLKFITQLIINFFQLEKHAVSVIDPVYNKSKKVTVIKLNIKGQLFDKKKEIFTKFNIDNKLELEELMQGELDVNIKVKNISLKDKKHAPLDLVMFNNINNSLIALLENGIKVLNDNNIYHCDIKARNLTFNLNDNKIRLIDWGLAYIDKLENKRPLNTTNKYDKFTMGGILYYGLVFGNFVLDEDLEKIDLQDCRESIDYNFLYSLTQFVGTYYKDYRVNLDDVIIKYLKRIKDWTTTTSVDDKNVEYFRKYILKNSDIYAILLVYITIFQYLPIQEGSWGYKVRTNIVKLILKYILNDDYAVKQYNIKEIITDLKNIFKEVEIGKEDEQSIEKNILLDETSNWGQRANRHGELYYFNKKTQKGQFTPPIILLQGKDKSLSEKKVKTQKKNDCFGKKLNKIQQKDQVCYICRILQKPSELQMGNRHQCRLCRNVVCNKHSTNKTLNEVYTSSNTIPEIKEYLVKCSLKGKVRMCSHNYQEYCLKHIENKVLVDGSKEIKVMDKSLK